MASQHAPPGYWQGGEDDIDALLAKFKLQDERHARVEVVEDCPPPSPRVYASFTPIPSQARSAAAVLGVGVLQHRARLPALHTASTIRPPMHSSEHFHSRPPCPTAERERGHCVRRRVVRQVRRARPAQRSTPQHYCRRCCCLRDRCAGCCCFGPQCRPLQMLSCGRPPAPAATRTRRMCTATVRAAGAWLGAAAERPSGCSCAGLGPMPSQHAHLPPTRALPRSVRAQRGEADLEAGGQPQRVRGRPRWVPASQPACQPASLPCPGLLAAVAAPWHRPTQHHAACSALQAAAADQPPGGVHAHRAVGLGRRVHEPEPGEGGPAAGAARARGSRRTPAGCLPALR